MKGWTFVEIVSKEAAGSSRPEYRFINLAYWGRTEAEALEEYGHTLPDYLDSDTFRGYDIRVMDSVPEGVRQSMIAGLERHVRSLEEQIRFCKMAKTDEEAQNV